MTLLLTASLATASMDVFGWQCAMAPAMPPASGHGGPVGCLPGWLNWAPAEPGPRLVIFALVPVLVVALIGYACHRTLRAYERWKLPPELPGDDEAHQRLSWPLTTKGFWHGLRPVRRQQMLHLAGAAALVSLYLAIVPASHPGARLTAVVAALILLALPMVTLGFPQAGRSGVNPHSARLSAVDRTGFDWWCGIQLVLSLTALATLLVARIWWQPSTPAQPVGLLPGDSWIWWGLTFAMGGLVIVAAALTAMARDTRELKLDRPFAAGFLAPLTLGLACVSGGIFAADLNLLVANRLIGSQFHNTGPAISGLPKGYPLVLPVPTFGFMVAFLAMAAAAIIVALVALGWFLLHAWRIAWTEYLKTFYDLEGFHFKKAWRQRSRIAVSWTKARFADHLGIAVAALSLAGIAGTAAFDGFAGQRFAIYWVTTVAHMGQWLAVGAAAALFLYTRQTFKDSGKRRQIGVLWDVGTFWPRASQPLAPPCYMERSIPETVNRLRRVLGDDIRNGPGTHTDPATDRAESAYIEKLKEELGEAAHRILLDQHWVLINGYSQGSPIAAAIIGQLPQELRDKVSLITVGCPLRRLYGRAFPTYFGQRCLLELASTLAPIPAGRHRQPVEDMERAKELILPITRWRNLIRPSDYVGSYVFLNPMDAGQDGDVDKRLLDPPRIIPPTEQHHHRYMDIPTTGQTRKQQYTPRSSSRPPIYGRRTALRHSGDGCSFTTIPST